MIFYFSGTGNSLKVTKAIANELGNTEIISMAKSENYCLEGQFKTIGFVYPTYFWGLPKKVIEFITNFNLGNNKDAYFYSVTTYGGSAGNAINQLYELLLKKHGIKLNFSKKLQMFSNYVIIYDMSKKIDKITKKSNKERTYSNNKLNKRAEM